MSIVYSLKVGLGECEMNRCMAVQQFQQVMKEYTDYLLKLSYKDELSKDYIKCSKDI